MGKYVGFFVGFVQPRPSGDVTHTVVVMSVLVSNGLASIYIYRP